MKAFCYASGQIGFGKRVPSGGIIIAEGPAKALRDFMCPVARHSRTSDTLLVPGIPECRGDQDAALDALLRFTRWIAKGAPKAIKIIHSAHTPSIAA